MKKAILILIVAAVCSISYSQETDLHTYLDYPTKFSFGLTMEEIKELNSEYEPLYIEDDQIGYANIFSSDILNSHYVIVRIWFKDSLSYLGEISFVETLDSSQYISAYRAMKLQVMIPFHTKITPDSLSHIYPEKAYDLITNAEYKFEEWYSVYNTYNRIMYAENLKGKMEIGLLYQKGE